MNGAFAWGKLILQGAERSFFAPECKPSSPPHHSATVNFTRSTTVVKGDFGDVQGAEGTETL
jgi:hypothetical protein